jgi:hypothetical protein
MLAVTMTDYEFLTTSALRWDVVYSTSNLGQADTIQTLLLDHQIPAFIEGTESCGDALPPQSVGEGFHIRVPHDQIEEAQETLHTLASGCVKDVS